MLDSLVNGIKRWVLSLPRGIVISETPPEDPSITSYINPYEGAFTEDEITWVARELERRVMSEWHEPNKVLMTDENGHVIDGDYVGGVQSDWNETDENNLAYIKNKPDFSIDIASKVSKSEITELNAIKIATKTGLVKPTVAEDGSIYTDENGAIYVL